MSLKERMEAGGGKLQTNAIKHLQKQFIKNWDTETHALSLSYPFFSSHSIPLSLCLSTKAWTLEMETPSAT